MNFPYNNQRNDVLVHTFIQGIEPKTQILLVLLVGGNILEKMNDELHTPLNQISQESLECHVDARCAQNKVAGMLEVDQFMTI